MASKYLGVVIYGTLILKHLSMVCVEDISIGIPFTFARLNILPVLKVKQKHK